MLSPSKTTPVPSTIATATNTNNWFSTNTADNQPNQWCCTAAISPEQAGQTYFDQTWKFPIVSSTWNKHLLLVCIYDSDGILAELMLNHTRLCILHAYKVIHTCLIAAGLNPKLQHLDNKACIILKEYISSQGITYQLVSLGIHCHYPAKRAIRTFKSHFIF